MQNILTILNKVFRRCRYAIITPYHHVMSFYTLYVNNAKFSKFSTHGIPYVSVALGGELVIGPDLVMNNNLSSNPIGRTQKCIFFVNTGGTLIIGKNVGMSFTSINCKLKIEIKDNVLIGGGTCIYDNDFHSMNVNERVTKKEVVPMAAVLIEKNVFIGANCTILKGVIIGENSIVGACSVVTKEIPANQIWAGNPAKFIKYIA